MTIKENSVNTDTTEKLNISMPTLSEIGDLFDIFHLYAKPYSWRWTQNTISTLFLKILDDLPFNKFRKNNNRHILTDYLLTYADRLKIDICRQTTDWHKQKDYILRHVDGLYIVA